MVRYQPWVLFLYRQGTAALGESYHQQRDECCAMGKIQKQRHSCRRGVKEGPQLGVKSWGALPVGH